MSFSTIVGQDGAVRLIRKALARNRVPQAYLFAGPEGVGKKLTALILAKALNCLVASDDACDTCKSCYKIHKGYHPDIGVIEAEGQFIKIDQIRELQKQVSYKPFEGRKKVSILNNAERLNLEAANALLKTLEEPPSDTVFILVSSSPRVLLPTLISRCQLIRFNTLSLQRMEQFLVEKGIATGPKAHLLAALSEGRPGRALNMDLEKILSLREQILELMNLMIPDGGQRTDLPPNRLRSPSLPDSRIKVLLHKIEEFARDRDQTEEFLDFLFIFYRDLLLLSEQGDPGLLTNRDLVSQLEKYKARLSSQKILKICQDIYQTKVNLQHHANLQLSLEDLFLKIIEI
jgi:DNA polymerase-3 subunit delta'